MVYVRTIFQNNIILITYYKTRYAFKLFSKVGLWQSSSGPHVPPRLLVFFLFFTEFGSYINVSWNGCDIKRWLLICFFIWQNSTMIVLNSMYTEFNDDIVKFCVHWIRLCYCQILFTLNSAVYEKILTGWMDMWGPMNIVRGLLLKIIWEHT